MDRNIINTCRVPKGTPVNADDRKPAIEMAGYHCPMPTASYGAMAIGNGGTASYGAMAIGNGGTASYGAMAIGNGGTASCDATFIGNGGAAQPRRGMTAVASHFNGWWVAANRGCNAQPHRDAMLADAQPHRGMTTVASHFNGWWVAASAGKRAFRYATTTRRTYRVPKGTPVTADDRIPAVETAGYHCPMPNGIMRRKGNRYRRRRCDPLTVSNSQRRRECGLLTVSNSQRRRECELLTVRNSVRRRECGLLTVRNRVRRRECGLLTVRNRVRRRECGLLTVRRAFGGEGRATADDKK